MRFLLERRRFEGKGRGIAISMNGFALLVRLSNSNVTLTENRPTTRPGQKVAIFQQLSLEGRGRRCVIRVTDKTSQAQLN